MVGVGTPGVGEYKEPTFIEDGPKFTLPKDEWFYVPSPATKDCTHAYMTPLLYLRKGTGFS